MTSGAWLIIGKMALTFGVLLAIPVWELIQLRRTRPPEEANDTRPEDPHSADDRPAS